MFKGQRICVVVPAYNEEERLGRVIKKVPSFIDHIIIVDDASIDQTSEKAENIGDGRAILIRHHTNQGVGGAIVTGHKKAIEIGAHISVVMAGDGQMDPKYLPDFLEAIVDEGYDYAKGNRFLRRKHTQGMPRIRVLGNIILSILNKAVSGYWRIFDSQNGYTAIRTSVLKELDLDHLAKGYQFENDMLIHLNLINASVKDVPATTIYRGVHSNIKLLRFMVKTLFFMTSRFVYRMRKKHIYLAWHSHA